jgi:2-polyprenyl-3-methyl-5-hydroxy-6-metoxy-1,4-benzoquinol methylase
MSAALDARNEPIETEPAPSCPVCSKQGIVRYSDLRDYVFGAAGEWSVRGCQATQCGTLWLDPRPRSSELIKAYRDYYTHSEDTLKRAKRSSRLKAAYHGLRDTFLESEYGYRSETSIPRWLRFLGFFHPGGFDWLRLDAMTLPAPGERNRLLEIGCGTGYLLERMRTLGWSVEGIDFDPKCVQAVTERGILCRCGDVREHNYAAATFDAIYMGNVIEHVDRPLELLAFCRQLLAPNGKLILVTPNASSLAHRWFQRDWRGLEPPRHLQLFTPNSLRNALESSGFAIDSARTTNRGFWYLSGMSLQIRRARQSGLKVVAAPVRLLTLRSLALQCVGRVTELLLSQKGEELLVTGRRP